MTLKAENIHLSLKQKTIINNASITCKPGELVAICGANGAGKSSLLKILAGEMKPSKGHISYNGNTISQLSSKSLARYRSVMPQQVQLDFPFLAQEVIEMGMIITRHKQARKKIIEQLCSLLSLGHLLSKPYTQCSGGEKQRIQLARVIGQLLQPELDQPRYLLLDESTSAMDIAMMQQAFTAIKLTVNENIGAVIVVHDLNLASYYADKIVMMSNKTTRYTGSPSDIMTTDKVAEVFSTKVSIIPHPHFKHPVILHG